MIEYLHMATKTLPITITKKNTDKFSVQIDRHGFERLADSLGLFNVDFLEGLDRAQKDVALGHIKKLNSLRELRKRR